MKDHLLSALFLGLFALLQCVSPDTCAAVNQWRSFGPYGGSILALVIDPSHPHTLYAGTNGGGVFKTGASTTDLVIDFGPPYSIFQWLNNASWSQLYPLLAREMIASDVYGK